MVYIHTNICSALLALLLYCFGCFGCLGALTTALPALISLRLCRHGCLVLCCCFVALLIYFAYAGLGACQQFNTHDALGTSTDVYKCIYNVFVLGSIICMHGMHAVSLSLSLSLFLADTLSYRFADLLLGCFSCISVWVLAWGLVYSLMCTTL